MRRVFFVLLVLLVIMGWVTQVNASLSVAATDRLGNKLIYDSNRDITWYDFTNSRNLWAQLEHLLKEQYWSATSYEYNAGLAWYLNLGYQNIYYKDEHYYSDVAVRNEQPKTENSFVMPEISTIYLFAGGLLGLFLMKRK